MSEQAAAGEESVSAELGERVRAIVAAAEGMAQAMRSDAEDYARARRREADVEAERRLREAREQADALLAERVARISDLSDRIVERAEELLARVDEAAEARARLQAVTRALGESVARMARELELEDGPGEAHPMAEEVRPLRPPGESAPRRLRPVAPASGGRGDLDAPADDARLVALQMAVAGRSREEVAAHLRQAFGVQDPAAILDQVFAERYRPDSAGA